MQVGLASRNPRGLVPAAFATFRDLIFLTVYNQLINESYSALLPCSLSPPPNQNPIIKSQVYRACYSIIFSFGISLISFVAPVVRSLEEHFWVRFFCVFVSLVGFLHVHSFECCFYRTSIVWQQSFVLDLFFGGFVPLYFACHFTVFIRLSCCHHFALRWRYLV